MMKGPGGAGPWERFLSRDGRVVSAPAPLNITGRDRARDRMKSRATPRRRAPHVCVKEAWHGGELAEKLDGKRKAPQLEPLVVLCVTSRDGGNRTRDPLNPIRVMGDGQLQQGVAFQSGIERRRPILASVSMNAAGRYNVWPEQGNVSLRVSDPFKLQPKQQESDAQAQAGPPPG
jgi:hypothetical protein